jgi:histidinol-phosphatase (PHP family)
MMNYHFHDENSSDAALPLTDHCAAAVRAGFREICVTNHVETLQPDGGWTVEYDEAVRRFERVLDSVLAARSGFPGLTIRFGAEFAFRPEWTLPLERLSASLPFDFVLGSLHDLDGVDVSGPHASAFFDGRPVEESYGRYFDALADLVSWGAFDAVAHFDLVKRYGHRAYGEYDPAALEQRVRPVLESMGRAGIGMEVNTSGAVQAPRSPYPGAAILAWAREAGVPYLTIGSDSHAPEHFAQGIAEGLRQARVSGWESLTTFEARAPAGSIPIDDAVGAGGRTRAVPDPGRSAG